ncbi:phospholipase A2 large subunit-like [Chironomus tepperi]|uniref:phospholipase A2 large subunit-like n=1 Tax=Chironomus tepperi TaxID=113505 RepID=UPI00391F7181
MDGSAKNKIERNRAAQERINLSFPGTKWCGPGNTANDFEDLGSDPEVDKCCRAHDHCDNIASGEEKYGLKNDDHFTRLHCLCDKEFKQCLRNVNSRRGNYIGNFYFNLRDRCYKEQHPIVECDEIHTKIFLRRCIKYMIDVKKPRVWQWFDLPFFDDEHDFEFVDDNEARDFVDDNQLYLNRNFL